MFDSLAFQYYEKIGKEFILTAFLERQPKNFFAVFYVV
jgi:hypothetical protein